MSAYHLTSCIIYLTEPSSSNIPPVLGVTEEDGKANENARVSLDCSDVEDMVSNILSSKFPEVCLP